VYKDGITTEEANALLFVDIDPFEMVVGSTIAVGLQQYEFDALVIFAFNIGVGGFRGSSVVALINEPNAMHFYGSLEAVWKSWNRSQGKVMKGLVNRRNCEWRIYTSALYERW
jgi:lysozyme